MPITTLDPKTALIVIDLQKGIAALPVAHSMEKVVANSRRLADAFREGGLPVVLVNVDAGAPGRTEQPRPSRAFEPDWADLLPDLGARPTDIRVTKKTWGAFASSDLEEKLKDLGVTQVVISGVATTAGVESTARQAYEAGFNVTLAIDAMTDMSQAAHDASVANIFPRIGETGTTEEILGFVKGARG